MIFEGSRYARSTVALVDGVEVIVSRRRRWREVRPDDLFHEVENGDKLDRLASRYYGQESLWWVIADVNDIGDLFEPLPVGRMLRIPSHRTVLEEVLT